MHYLELHRVLSQEIWESCIKSKQLLVTRFVKNKVKEWSRSLYHRELNQAKYEHNHMSVHKRLTNETN